MFSLYTVLQRFSTAASGELPQNYAILEQWDCVSSLEFFCESLDWSFESFASLRHLFRLVQSWPERTKLRTRANSLSSIPSSTSFSVMFSSCLSSNRTGEVFSYAAIQTMFMLAEVHLALHYSFKIFPQFWLAKSTPIIHNNQLLMTKFGRILCLTSKWRQKCSLLQVNALLTEKTWGRSWVVLVVKTKMADTPLVSRVRTTAGTRPNNS